jgi:phosphatidate cytidylyltransferase
VSIELQKRIFTSLFLLSLLALMFFYSFILIISLIIISIIAWIEFYNLISKIFKKKFQRFIYKAISLLYFSLLVFIILFIESRIPEFKIVIIYSISISIASDIGGLTFGKIFKGKRLTKISPNKTISGSFGSFIFSLMLIPFFNNHFENKTILIIFFITLIVSFFSQIGDLFISYLKRKAKVKDSSDLLPGHGGFLDRIDGILLSIPVGLFMFKIF